jgi:ABC-type amino acid transport system permease subunit
MMAQAAFIYFGLIGAGFHIDIFTAALLIVSINTGAYMAETVRGGILSIDPGQTEGAKAIGMTHFQSMINVIMPQALRNIMPQIGNNLIINIKDTCVLAMIGVFELMLASRSAAGANYRFFETYTVTMAMYLAMTLFFSRLLRYVEKKMDGDKSYDLATHDTLAHTSGMISYREDKRR